MKRQCLQKRFLSSLIFICISLSFSFASIADPFTGAYMTIEIDPVTGIPTTVIKDVNPSGQTFSGQNVIELNAYNNAPTLTDNTFNGSTDIKPDFTNITSSGNTYNGSVDIDYNGLGGTLDSNGDRFQSTTVTAESSDISISNGTFNGTTNINAQSVSLGSITQMDSLLDITKKVIDEIFIFRRLMSVTLTSSSNSITNTSPSGNSVTIPLNTISYRRLTFSNGAFAIETVNPTGNSQYGNFRAQFIFMFQGLVDSYKALGDGLVYVMTGINTVVTNLHTNLLNYIKGTGTYTMYTFTRSGETYSISSTSNTQDFRNVLMNRINLIWNLLDYFCSRFFEWYYPLDNTLPEYWRYYNTDTAESEEIGLAGLMYNISWYLGQMYVLQSASQSLDNMTDQVEAITDTLEEAEQKENAVISSISSGINSFAPDLTEIGAFRALSWTSNYLQQMFVALGTYGTVILVGLLLGVCMQFIGYFKYK